MADRVLVTGASGFIGRHISRELIRRGHHVTGVDTEPADPRLDNLPPKPGFGRYTHSQQCMLRYLDGPKPRHDLIIHCAYHVGGREGIDRCPENHSRNALLDAALFDYAVRIGQARVLYFSSSAVYPVHQQTGRLHRTVRLAEHLIYWGAEIIGMPDEAYGWAKLAGERLARSAARAGVRVHIVRPFSGYGADQASCYPFPAIVSRARQGDLTVWGPPGQCRDWVHVDDVVRGALAVVDADVTDPVNLCTGEPTEFGDLALRIARTANVKTIGKPQYQLDKPTGVMCRIGDPERMRTIYKPSITIDDGIRRALKE